MGSNEEMGESVRHREKRGKIMQRKREKEKFQKGVREREGKGGRGMKEMEK